MPTLQIYGAPQSNFVWVTRIVAVEKGIEHELVPVMPHTTFVEAYHPLGKIPALRHGDLVLGESRAICLYLDRMFSGPSLLPEEPALAAKAEQWVSIVCTHVDPLLMRQYAGAYFFPHSVDGKPDRALIDSLLQSVEAQIAFLNGAVEATAHLSGTTFTLADAYLLPILFYMRELPESGAMLRRHRHLRAYLDRHLQRPSVKATIPPPMSALELQVAG